MSHHGRNSALAVGLGLTAAAGGLSLLASHAHMLLPVVIGLCTFATAVFSLGWLLGTKYDRLKLEATMDMVTALYNRRFIEDSFKTLLRQAARKRKRMTVMILDVNDFKDVNDRLGHLQGDTALGAIAATLKQCGDRGEIIGRWGGDEFIIICPYAEEKLLERLMNQIHEQLQSISLRTGLRLSVSVGHASYPEHGTELCQLTQSADKRMYADKYLHKKQATEPAALQA
ncbi:GGDEF domain-containing protein [Paenibacillus sp. OV219]|uniref:GGDEF domain-containing protein n=1 Tax=Paenibacillus sp. OV219 TaxID=1884377 RepID=UPI0008B2B18C|nr:GGDEF domain-containing protein [Paenibacillus sp. OV219]SEO15227.1 diguanylate cyclase (GGDEF) domain-containing protein [Paenibacillus sp. OV219]